MDDRHKIADFIEAEKHRALVEQHLQSAGRPFPNKEATSHLIDDRDGRCSRCGKSKVDIEAHRLPCLKEVVTKDETCQLRGYFHDSQEIDSCGNPAVVKFENVDGQDRFLCRHHAEELFNKANAQLGEIKRALGSDR